MPVFPAVWFKLGWWPIVCILTLGSKSLTFDPAGTENADPELLVNPGSTCTTKKYSSTFLSDSFCPNIKVSSVPGV